MKKTFFAEVILLALLTILLVLLLDPFNIIMKLMLSGVVAGALVVLYIVKFFIIWKEKPQDERDLSHRFYSSWVSYYTVSALLFIGVLAESLTGHMDVWLIISLAGLFVTKLGTLIYLEIYK
jgi:hypothetical protein